jgi:hypothetical protein
MWLLSFYKDKMKMRTIQLAGGLGNQLFQYSFFLYLKSQYPNDVINFDDRWYDTKRKHHEKINLNKLGVKVSIHYERTIFWLMVGNRFTRNFLEIIQKGFENKIIHTETNLRISASNHKNIYYRGFWQNAEFAKFLTLEMLDNFISNNFRFNEKISFLRDEICSTNSIGLHIRRGDYLTNTRFMKRTHKELNIEYYLKAINIAFKSNSQSKIFIFSDDIFWAIKNLSHLSDSIKFIDPKKYGTLDSFFLMLCCKNFIISNSTYSWWPAFLRRFEASLIIAPDNFALSRDLSENKNLILL